MNEFFDTSKMLPAGVSPADAFMTRCFWVCRKI